MEENKKKKAKIGRIVYYCLIGLFGTAFVVSLVLIGIYFFNSSQVGSEYDELSNIRQSILANQTTTATIPGTTASGNTGSTTVPTQPPVPVTTVPAAPTEPQILPEQKPFYEINNDMVGWIYIPGTNVNYPVMQTPDNKDYYLKRTFYKMWSDWGAIYAREECDVNAPSDNITLYGHHMADNSMFASLDYYKNQAFWQEHQTFSFDTLYQRHTYQVFAVFKTTGNIGGFPYHQFVNAKDEAEFNQFVADIKSMAFYETGISAEYGDKLLCLSTCEYTLNNGRFIVVAKRIS